MSPTRTIPCHARYRPAGMARAALAMVASVLLAAGCVGLHPDPRVKPGLEVNATGSEPVNYLPPGPQPSSSAEAVLRGFTRAAGYPGEGATTVAKEYLAPQLAGRWNPETAILVLAKDPTLRRIAADRYQLTGTPLARLDADGRLTPTPDAEPVTADLTLAQIGGRWRITSLPADFGRWVTEAGFAQLTRQVAVYYLSADGEDLIPDLRYVVADRMATRVARLQLGELPGYLAGAARTATGGGIHLAVDSVPVDGGVATVDLAAGGVSNDPAVRRAIWGQLVASLTRLVPVSAVEVTVEGATLDVPGVSGPVASLTDLGYGARSPAPAGVLPLLRAGTGLYPLDPAQIRQPTGLGEIVERGSAFPPVRKEFGDLALAVTGAEIAGVAGGELVRYRQREMGSVPFFADHLSGPAYDPAGTLWVAGSDAKEPRRGRIWVIDSGVWPADESSAKARALDVPWLTGRRPVAIALDLEGHRIAVLSTDTRGRNSRLDVAGVTRSGGRPTGLAERPLQLVPTLTGLRDLVWISDREIAVLGQAGTEPLRPHLVDLGQRDVPLAPVKGARRISTLGGPRGLVVTTDAAVWQRAGGSWLELKVGSELVVPGR